MFSVVLLFLLALGVFAPGALADDSKDPSPCGPVPGGQSPNGGTCAPSEPIVIIVDIWHGTPVVVVVSPGEDRPRKHGPAKR